MAMLAPDPPAPLESALTLGMDVAGAESNALLYLAQLGHRVAWASRLGSDSLGRRVVATVGHGGVDIERVEFLSSHPTGVFFKDPRANETDVHYYRSASAASTMDPRFADGLGLESARVILLSGVTPALSHDCAKMVDHVLELASRTPSKVAFDVNYRPKLWSRDVAAPHLLRLARRADLVFVGLDEAAALWEVSSPAEVRALMPRVPNVVVKDGGNGATAFSVSASEFVPAPRVPVIEVVGAGDAFAAGYLSCSLRGGNDREALHEGHRVAAAAISSSRDVAEIEEQT
jgi:2-dehydro-3-deoxygluconokinase